MTGYLLAIDQGTTGSTALVMDLAGRTLGRSNVEFPQYYPQPGWVEHAPEEIWQSVLDAIAGALLSSGISGDKIDAIGITNQRETSLLWDRATGHAPHRAIVWQCRRTADHCAALRSQGLEQQVRSTTGLVLDPYFSATKLAWLLDNVPHARSRAEDGSLAFGTIDSFLVFRLTSGAVHVTDVSNASRTLLMNLCSLQWDDNMCRLFAVPKSVLPTIVSSAGIVGVTSKVPGLPDGIPIAGIAGDQQAALFGQSCFEVGDVKCTYGTGAFVLINTGATPVMSRHGLLTTVAWKIGDQPVYALEGSAFVAGAAVQWLRDGLKIIANAADIEPLARTVDDSGGVAFVPALAGLGAPYWDANARGLICGITRGTNAGHLARATLEGIAHEVSDLMTAMQEDLGRPVRKLRVDGGASANDLLMKMQADFAGIIVERPNELETTARGAAMLAALGKGLFASQADASGMSQVQRRFEVSSNDASRAIQRSFWKDAVQRARGAPA